MQFNTPKYEWRLLVSFLFAYMLFFAYINYSLIFEQQALSYLKIPPMLSEWLESATVNLDIINQSVTLIRLIYCFCMIGTLIMCFVLTGKEISKHYGKNNSTDELWEIYKFFSTGVILLSGLLFVLYMSPPLTGYINRKWVLIILLINSIIAASLYLRFFVTPHVV